MAKSFICPPGINTGPSHLSSNSTKNLLYNNNGVSNYNFINTNANSNSTKNYTNINFFSKIQKNEEANKSKKSNTNFNEINFSNKNNNLNKKNAICLKSNSNGYNKILINRNNSKNKNVNNYTNHLMLNDINMTEKNSEIIYFPSTSNINFNNYKAKSTRNSTDIKNSINRRKITYSSYDLNNEDKNGKYINRTNIEEGNKSQSKQKTLYNKNLIKTNYSHFFYDSNKNIFKNNSPEENHFETIVFLQKMKSNNCAIK